MASNNERIIKHTRSGVPVTLNYTPTSDYGRNGDQVYVRSVDREEYEHLVKQNGTWISLTTSQGVDSLGRRAAKKGGTIATTIQNVTIEGGTGTGSGVSNHDALDGLLDDDHTQYVHKNSARTIPAQHTYSNAGSPFLVTSDTLVSNLNADKLDGKSPGTSSGDIAYYDGNTRVADSQKVDGKEPGTGVGNIAYYDANTRVVDSQLWDGNDFASYLDQAVKQASTPTLGDLTISSPSNIYALSHDSFANFVTDEHIAHSGVSITAGAGLTGGGTIAASRTLNVIGGDGITANADEIEATIDNTTIGLNASNGTGALYVKNDSIGDTQLTYNTGQHLTTTSDVEFDDITSEDIISDTLQTGGIDLNGSMTITGGITGDHGSNNLAITSTNPDTTVEGTTFSGNNVTIPGTLTVTGTTTTLDTEYVEVKDNILNLNRTQGDPDSATAVTSGIEIYRGSGVSPMASLIFDDAVGADDWTLNFPLHIETQTNPQLKASYSNSIFTSFGTDSSGDLTISPTGDDIFLGPASTDTMAIGTSNYASQTTGWQISNPGSADLRYIFTDELHAKAFIADLEQALAGGQIIAKSVTVLDQDFTLPSAGNTGTVTVKDLPSAEGMQVFQTNDWIRFRSFSRANGGLTIADAWGTVSSPSDNGDGTQDWTFTRGASGYEGSASGVIKADAIVLDYGVSGNGFHEVNAIDGQYAVNSPYAQIVTWSSANGPYQSQTVKTRLGNLKGLAIGSTGEYGLFAGDTPTANTGKWIKAGSQGVHLQNTSLELHDGTSATDKINHSLPALFYLFLSYLLAHHKTKFFCLIH